MNTSVKQLIEEKALAGTRITKEEAKFLLQDENKEFLLSLADQTRKLRVGETVYYATTLFIHPTNLCELSCSFCSFYAKPGWEKAWFMTPDQIIEKIQRYQHHNLNEIHIVGGLWRECTLDYYEELFRKIKQLDSTLHIKAMTAVEYDFLAKLHNISVEEVFLRLKEAGLDSLPGGGAEVLDEKVRKLLAPQKIKGDEFLAIHEIAHKLGIPSNISMLWGSIESWDDLIDHLDQTRLLQDKTQGFTTFVPLKYHVENNALGKRTNRLKPKEPEKVYALSRLMLDNIDHLKVLWNYLGLDVGKQMLLCGANDFASTALDEKIIIMAGGVQVQMNEETIRSMIEQVGRIPQKVHSGEVRSRHLCQTEVT